MAQAQGLGGCLRRRGGRQGARPGMDYGAVFDILLFHGGLLQEHIRSGLPGKGKAAVAVRGQGDKGQGGNSFFTELRVDNPYPVIFHSLHQETAKVVVPNAEANANLQAAAGRGDGRVCRRASGIPDIAGRLAAGSKIDQELSDTVQVHSASAFLLFRYLLL